MKTCPLFGKCGGCKFDFTSDVYRAKKLSLLKNIPITNDPIWIAPGGRRRIDLAFVGNQLGFYEPGTKNIVPIDKCMAVTPTLQNALDDIVKLPWHGSGAVLITECDNGVDIGVTSGVPYFTTEFKNAVDKNPAIRVTWNDIVVKQTEQPVISFGDHVVNYPPNAFLQPSRAGETALRDLVVGYAFDDLGRGIKSHDDKMKIADLFAGTGSFTFALNADGYDIVGAKHVRDLFKKPLTVQNLKKYDCVVMDPPRAGAMAQSRELARSSVPRVIYVSCNPDTFMRDREILERGGYKMIELTPVDQFVGSNHWELVGLFQKS